MKQYDFIFAGGGLAGLSLAYHLVRSPLRDCSMLIVDREAKQRNDRTWGFWAMQPTPFDGLVQREWKRIHFFGDRFQNEIDLEDYRYKLIRGIDFYRFAHQELARYPNVEFVQGAVETIGDREDCARVYVDGQMFAGRWVFDSRFNAKAFKPNPRRYHYLRQYFKGWEIETPNDVFDSDTATLLDFRTPQKNAMRFFYVLPFSARHALVEYVTVGPDQYDQALKVYVQSILEIQDYRVVATEGGVNPMSDYNFTRRTGPRVMNIGTRGGRVKPSTGYAFLRVQQDSAAIVRSLQARGHPFDVPPDSRRYRLYDALMLEVMQRHGEEIKPIFTALFKNNPITRVLRFLDERASVEENSLLIVSLPPRLFLQAMFSMKVFHLAPSWREI
jgi:lycopene beta-cyclase